MKKYQNVAKKINQYIHEKDLKQGDKLPKINQMVKDFNVSKATVLQALALLNQKGVIYKVQGSGIFVRRGDIKNYIRLTGNSGFTGVITNVRTKLISFEEMELPSKVKKALHTEEKIGYKTVRVRCQENKPIVLETAYYLKSIVTFLSKEIAQGSIFKYIQEGLQRQIRFSDKFMKMGRLDKEEATLLELNEGDPALKIREIYYCDGGTPFDYSELIYNYKNAKLYSESPDELI